MSIFNDFSGNYLQMKKNTIIFFTALSIVFLDQLTKFLIKTKFQLNESLPIIKNILHFTYVTNTGSAFGLFKGFDLFFIIFSFTVIAAILYFMKNIKQNEKLMQVSFGLLLGGTIGNLADRILFGHVIDFIDFRIWPVFNIADSAITVSIVLLVILLWKK